MERPRACEQESRQNKLHADLQHGLADPSGEAGRPSPGGDGAPERFDPGSFVERELAGLRAAIRDALAERHGSFAGVFGGGTRDGFVVASLNLLSEVCGMLISTFQELGSTGRLEPTRSEGRNGQVRGAGPIVRRAARPGPDEIAPDGADRAILPAEGGYVFRPEGEYWTVAYEGKVSRLKAMRGFQYIAHLLRHPHQDIAAIDLVSAGGTMGGRMSKQELAEHDLRVVGLGGGDPLLDSRARAEYRNRLRELYEERDRAQRDNDLGHLAKLQEELETLAGYLAAATRHGGRSRAMPSPAERARVNVRNCFTAATKTIKQHNPGLSRHLMNTIKTGTFCSYVPDRPIEWLL